VPGPGELRRVVVVFIVVVLIVVVVVVFVVVMVVFVVFVVMVGYLTMLYGCYDFPSTGRLARQNSTAMQNS
jgi:hypothetical protein